jgi:hypothetical protein
MIKYGNAFYEEKLNIEKLEINTKYLFFLKKIGDNYLPIGAVYIVNDEAIEQLNKEMTIEELVTILKTLDIQPYFDN